MLYQRYIQPSPHEVMLNACLRIHRKKERMLNACLRVHRKKERMLNACLRIHRKERMLNACLRIHRKKERMLNACLRIHRKQKSGKRAVRAAFNDTGTTAGHSSDHHRLSLLNTSRGLARRLVIVVARLQMIHTQQRSPSFADGPLQPGGFDVVHELSVEDVDTGLWGCEHTRERVVGSAFVGDHSTEREW